MVMIPPIEVPTKTARRSELRHHLDRRRAHRFRLVVARVGIAVRLPAAAHVGDDDPPAPSAMIGAISSKSFELRVRPWRQMTGSPAAAPAGIIAGIEATGRRATSIALGCTRTSLHG